MSQYDDAYSGAVNFLSNFDYIYQLKTVLGKAKEAEQYIEQASVLRDKAAVEHKKILDTIEDAKQNLKAVENDTDRVSLASRQRLEDALDERESRFNKDMEERQRVADDKLQRVEDKIESLKAETMELEAKRDVARERTRVIEKELAKAEGARLAVLRDLQEGSM